MVRHELPLPRARSCSRASAFRLRAGQVARAPRRGARARRRRAARGARAAVAPAAGQGRGPPLALLPRARPRSTRELLAQLAAAGATRGPARRAVPRARPLGARARRVRGGLRARWPTARGRRSASRRTSPGCRRAALARVAALAPAELHVDLVRAPGQLDAVLAALRRGTRLSAGVVDGRNVWATDLDRGARPARRARPPRSGSERLTIAPSCSLLHVPVRARRARRGSTPSCAAGSRSASEKLDELRAARGARSAPTARRDELLADARRRVARARRSAPTHDPRCAAASRRCGRGHDRAAPLAERARRQRERLGLPALPTTTIGSFPQTAEIRDARGATARRRARRRGLRALPRGEDRARRSARRSARPRRARPRRARAQRHGRALRRAARGLRVHGRTAGCSPTAPLRQAADPLRRRLAARADDRALVAVRAGADRPAGEGHAHRAGDDPAVVVRARRPAAARDVRADRARDPRRGADLEAAGAAVVQVDEPALREGLPLRARGSGRLPALGGRRFRLAARRRAPTTQVHTHMCYSEFGDMVEPIARLDADVISIETSRSGMELLDAFRGVRLPERDRPRRLRHPLAARAPARRWRGCSRWPRSVGRERLWVNPDCGLKTRGWDEARPRSRNMVAAARRRARGRPVAA